MNKALILAGSNIEPRETHLENAAAEMKKRGIAILKASSIYSSASWGFTADDFFNQAFLIETKEDPFRLMNILLEIEKDMGRVRTGSEVYESRKIDLDILLYNKEIINSEQLHLPHPRFAQRRFALAPAAEIAGEMTHPVYMKSVRELLAECPDNGEVKKI